MHLAAAYLSLACRLEPGPALQLLLARRGLAANEAAILRYCGYLALLRNTRGL